jgi:glycosyltransferase involved in cell wall biosynthesis
MLKKRGATRIAVIMPAYNAEKTIGDAVNSVIESLCPVHLIISDDASRIPAERTLAGMGLTSPAVTVLRAEHNGGPSTARNRAARYALERDYDLIALLDADDISMPDRFIKQAEFLCDNPLVGVVGSWGKIVDADATSVLHVTYPPIEPSRVRRGLCFDNCIINTSAMFRSEVLKSVGLWREDMWTAEDYDLFCRVAQKFDIANLPEFLVQYRSLDTGLSRSAVTAQRRGRLRVQLRYLPKRLLYWEAWAGLAISLARAAIPTPVVETVKRSLRIEKFFG